MKETTKQSRAYVLGKDEIKLVLKSYVTAKEIGIYSEHAISNRKIVLLTKKPTRSPIPFQSIEPEERTFELDLEDMKAAVDLYLTENGYGVMNTCEFTIIQHEGDPMEPLDYGWKETGFRVVLK
jgi:hypothetical protein